MMKASPAMMVLFLYKIKLTHQICYNKFINQFWNISNLKFANLLVNNGGGKSIKFMMKSMS